MRSRGLSTGTHSGWLPRAGHGPRPRSGTTACTCASCALTPSSGGAVRDDEPGNGVVQHSDSVTVGHVVHQRAQPDGSQGDGGQPQRQHHSVPRSPASPGTAGTSSRSRLPGLPARCVTCGQRTSPVGGYSQPIVVISHPRMQPDASQHHQASDGNQQPGDDCGQLHRLTRRSRPGGGESVPAAWPVRRFGTCCRSSGGRPALPSPSLPTARLSGPRIVGQWPQSRGW